MQGLPRTGVYELRRVLRLGDSLAIVVGIIVGSGIFFTPSVVARELDYFGIVLLAWILGGIVSLCGALTYAELASVWPHTGGIYVYLREAFHPLVSFLFGWAQLVVIRPSVVAGISVIFAQYVGHFLPLPNLGIKLVAVGGIVSVAIVNYLGVRFTSLVQNILTLIKIFALLWIAWVCLFSQTPAAPPLVLFPPAWTTDVWIALGIAMIAIYWTFDGWSEITSIAGEVRDPGRTIPKALLVSSLGILFMYLLVNYSFIHVLGMEGVRNSTRVAADAMILTMGPRGGDFISAAAIIATLGTLNGAMLTGPRIFFAMAVDGTFFEWARKVDAKFRTPSTAIATQTLLAVPLVITWKFEQLATYFVFVALIFYSLGAAAVFQVRRRSLGSADGYRTWGYPVTPAVFILVAVAILVNTAASPKGINQAVVGSFILLLGVPVYYIWIRRRSASERSP